METLLSKCADRLEFSAFLARILEGLGDDGDIKLLCHEMLIDLSTHSAAAPIVVTTLERRDVRAAAQDADGDSQGQCRQRQIERHQEVCI